MKQNRLFQAIGAVDDELLMRSEQPGNRSKKIVRRYIYAAVAAILVLLFTVKILDLTFEQPVTPMPPSLRAFEGFMTRAENGYYNVMIYHDLETLLKNSNNLLNNQNLKKELPVYEFYKSREAMLLGTNENRLSEKQMDEYATYYAGCDHTIITGHEESYQSFNNTEQVISEKTFYCDNGLRISVVSDGTIYLMQPQTLEKPVQTDCGDIYKNAVAYYKYYFEAYARYFDDKNPVYAFTDFRTNFTDPSASVYPITRYEQSDDPVISYVNYGNILPGDENNGDVIVIRKGEQILGECYGEYPILSVEEAKQKLYAGEGLTEGEQFAVTADTDIAGVELIYSGAVLQPVYVFYVELTDEQCEIAFAENGGNAYQSWLDGAGKPYMQYYIPAVDGQYLK